MYWQHKKDHSRQIIVSRCGGFDENPKVICISFQEFSDTTSPISSEEFENYEGIPQGISKNGFEKIKEFFLRQEEAYKYICFTGIS